jgi:acyl carrier protein
MDRLNSVLAEVFNRRLDKVSDADGPQTIEEWDSLRHMIMVSALEKAFNVKLTTADVIEMVNVGKIKDILRRHKVKLQE